MGLMGLMGIVGGGEGDEHQGIVEFTLSKRWFVAELHFVAYLEARRRVGVG